MINNWRSVVPPVTGEANCFGCMLNRKSSLPVYGEGKKGILIVMDAQTPIMATSKSYGIGMEYTFVKNHLLQYNIFAEEDCWVTSAIQCFTEEPKEKHMDCCRANLHKTVSMLKPQIILTFGELAASSFFNDVIPGDKTLNRTHGFIHNCRTFGCYLVATFMPGSCGRRDSVRDKLISRDMHVAVMALKMPYKAWKDEAMCIYTLNTEEAVERLECAIANERERLEAIDFETTGLKPHNPEHEIVSCAIADSADNSYAFLVNDEIKPVLKRYMNTAHIHKIAHNMAFELSWCAAKLGTWGRNMSMDSMILAHILDNRDTHITGIKFLAPMLLGCPVWNEHIEGYLAADKKMEEVTGNNTVNNIKRIPTRDLLIYNAIDSLVEYRATMVMLPLVKNIEQTFPTRESIAKLAF